MNSKANTLALACLLTLLTLSGPGEAAKPKKGGGRGVTVTMEFLDPGMKIYSDGGGPYVPSGGNGDIFGEIRNDSRELRMAISGNRFVRLEFTSPIGESPIDPTNGTVDCRVTNNQTEFFQVLAPPSLRGNGYAQSTYFWLTTGLEMLIEEDEDEPGIFRVWGQSLERLDLLAMEVDDVKYVQLQSFFQEAGYEDRVYVRFNQEGYIEGGWIHGIAKVRAQDDPSNPFDGVDTWFLSPADMALAPVTDLDQANLGNQTGNGAKRPKDRLWGACDFGDFKLPFELKVSRL